MSFLADLAINSPVMFALVVLYLKIQRMTNAVITLADQTPGVEASEVYEEIKFSDD